MAASSQPDVVYRVGANRDQLVGGQFDELGGERARDIDGRCRGNGPGVGHGVKVRLDLSDGQGEQMAAHLSHIRIEVGMPKGNPGDPSTCRQADLLLPGDGTAVRQPAGPRRQIGMAIEHPAGHEDGDRDTLLPGNGQCIDQIVPVAIVEGHHHSGRREGTCSSSRVEGSSSVRSRRGVWQIWRGSRRAGRGRRDSFSDPVVAEDDGTITRHGQGTPVGLAVRPKATEELLPIRPGSHPRHDEPAV